MTAPVPGADPGVAGMTTTTVVPDLPDLPAPRGVDGRRVFDAVTYAAPVGYRPLLLDVHVPAGAGAAVPCVVWIHGGAWWEGDRRFPPGSWPGDDHWFRLLVGAGLAVATIDYRLSSEATYPAQLADTQAAIRFLRHHARSLGIDPDRIGVCGESAGGHLAAMAALTGREPVAPTDRSVVGPSSAVAAAVALYPVTDLSAFGPDGPDAGAGVDEWDGPSPEEALLGRPAAEAPGDARAASPVGHVHAGAPPMLLLHGKADSLVPVGHSERLAAALEEAGAPVRLITVPGADHCFTGVDPVPVLETAVGYLREHLRA